MDRDAMEKRRRDWLWNRWEAAQDLFRLNLITRSEFERAMDEAESGNWAGPLKLRDGTELPEEMPGMPKAVKRERSHNE